MSQYLNLYNPALRRQREWLTLTSVVSATAVALVLVLVGGAWFRHLAATASAELRETERQIKEKMAAVEQLKARAQSGVPPELMRLHTQLSARQEVLKALDESASVGTAGFSDYLRGLARQNVAGLWLTGFSVAREGDAMQIRGRMTAAGLLPGYIRRLNAEKSFQGRKFSALSVVQQAVPVASPVAGATASPPVAARFVEFALTSVRADDTVSATAKGSAVKP